MQTKFFFQPPNFSSYCWNFLISAVWWGSEKLGDGFNDLTFKTKIFNVHSIVRQWCFVVVTQNHVIFEYISHIWAAVWWRFFIFPGRGLFKDNNLDELWKVEGRKEFFKTIMKALQVLMKNQQRMPSLRDI